MKNLFLLMLLSIFVFSCDSDKTVQGTKNEETKVKTTKSVVFPASIKVEGIALNPEGIEFDKNDNTFLLSSLNAAPITKVNLDGTYKPFTSGEKFPLSTAGLQIDYKRNRLLAAGFNGTELMDKDPKTRGTSFLRIYNLKTGVIEKDINLSSLVPDAQAYMANDIAVDNDGNAYITDWYAGVVYKVDMSGKPSIFWRNNTGQKGGANGIEFHKDGYLLVSLVRVNEKGLYADYGLVKIPLADTKAAKLVDFSKKGFTGFDGMIFKANGNIVGVTNSGTAPGGNIFMELSSKDNWESADIVNTKAIKGSTTVAVTPSNESYIINQDFTKPMATTWMIKQIKI